MVALTNTMSKNIENAHKDNIPYYKFMLHFIKAQYKHLSTHKKSYFRAGYSRGRIPKRPIRLYIYTLSKFEECSVREGE